MNTDCTMSIFYRPWPSKPSPNTYNAALLSTDDVEGLFLAHGSRVGGMCCRGSRRSSTRVLV